MIKLTFCLRRKAGLSLEEFQRYWRDQHAPLVAKHSQVLGIRRYVQSHTVPHDAISGAQRARAASADAVPEPYDGVAELWFDSEAALARLESDSDAAQAGLELLQDEAKFIDLTNSPLWLAREHQIVGD
ncbi:MAG: EthD domain-containing protein [Pseudomonadota bacterium]